MKKDILKHLLASLVVTVFLVSCSEDSELKTCALQKLSMERPDSYQLIDYNANGTIASVTVILSGVESERFDYSYASDKISIYLTNLGVTNKLECEIGLDAQGRPISRKHDDIIYQTYVYSGDKLDHIMTHNKDSVVFSYSGTNKNPDKSDVYVYNAANQTWSYLLTTTITYDEQPNPTKGLILPAESNWNVETSLQENNVTSYSSNGETWNIAYTYNAEGYPVSRTLTSDSYDYSETDDFTYDCQ